MDYETNHNPLSETYDGAGSSVMWFAKSVSSKNYTMNAENDTVSQEQAYYDLKEQFWRSFTSFGGVVYHILAFWRVLWKSIAKFGDFFAKINSLDFLSSPASLTARKASCAVPGSF
jgi:hypothetical protein